MLARTRTAMPFLDFAAQVRVVGDAYRAARAAGNATAAAEALEPLDNTWAEWFVGADEFSRIDYREVPGAPVTQSTAVTGGQGRRAGERGWARAGALASCRAGAPRGRLPAACCLLSPVHPAAPAAPPALPAAAAPAPAAAEPAELVAEQAPWQAVEPGALQRLPSAGFTEMLKPYAEK